ncbi:MAG: hypothetical protein AB1705_14730 [Verrucomicrobiota bacterium]
MIVDLPPAESKRLSRLVKSGAFATAADALTEGLRLLEERELVRNRPESALRQQVNLGLDEIRQRRLIRFDDALANHIKAKGRKNLSTRRKKTTV